MQERRSLVAAVETALWRRRLVIPAAAAAVAGADQATKTWALDHLDPYTPRHVAGPTNLLLTYNSGAAFSLGHGVTPIVEAAVVAMLVVLLAASRRATRTASFPASLGLGLVMGGAVGNLVDRFVRDLPHHPGAVVDFIQAVSWWPVFNVADASIVVGVILVGLAYRAAQPGRGG